MWPWKLLGIILKKKAQIVTKGNGYKALNENKPVVSKTLCLARAMDPTLRGAAKDLHTKGPQPRAWPAPPTPV